MWTKPSPASPQLEAAFPDLGPDQFYGGLELRPREYFARQIYASFWFEKGNVARTLELLGEDNVMFETDFPHPTCLYPEVRGHVQECLGDVPAPVQRKVLYENAAKVYGLSIEV